VLVLLSAWVTLYTVLHLKINKRGYRWIPYFFIISISLK